MHESSATRRREPAVTGRRLSSALCITVGLALIAGVAAAGDIVEPAPRTDAAEGPSPLSLLWYVVGFGGGVSEGDGFELVGSVEDPMGGENLLAALSLSAPMAQSALAGEASLDDVITEVALAPLSPNPNHGTANISWALPRPTNVRLTIHDVQGRELAVVASGAFEGGRYTRTWRADRARGIGAAGIYFVRLTTNEKIVTSRMVVVQ